MTARPAVSALGTLVAGIVDYAGLFPPAALDMRTAVANYAAYRTSTDAELLGRFVTPVARLQEWIDAIATLAPDEATAWNGARLSALLSGEFASEAEAITAFNGTSPFGVRIDVAEGRTATADSVLAMAAAMPDDVTLYCELPHRDDPAILIDAVKSATVRAKLRTGVTPPAEIVRFLRRCSEAGVTCKVTAGLHHPLRGEFRLTYASDAPRGEMYGFLNLFLAAAAIRSGVDDDAATRILLVTDAADLRISASSIVVLGVELDQDALQSLRESGVVAFGSCSYREPVDELAALFPAS
ncbi:MAG TPA: hypothetical protein VE861_05875 [Gemmatimonadaceae bacterium]|nr:hypothetical protein [Gemmatimonadaceae bacterium]